MSKKYKNYEIQLSSGKLIYLEKIDVFRYGAGNIVFERDGLKVAVFSGCNYFREVSKERPHYDYYVRLENGKLAIVRRVNNIYYYKGKIKFYDNDRLVAGFLDTVSFYREN